MRAIEAGMSRRRLLVAVAIGLGAALLFGTVAAAEEGPSRAEYVSQLEATCKPRALATQKAVKGVRADVKAERLAVAATKFSRAARIFGATLREISPVPRPPADQATLARWFGYLSQEESNLRKIAAALRAGHTIASQRYSSHFVRAGNRANNVVLAFGFNYCSFKFTRFE
jgi:hypothetical protein